MPHKNKKVIKAKAVSGSPHAGKKVLTGDDHSKRDSSTVPNTNSISLPDELTCGICYDLLDGARQTPCCGGLSCKACVETLAASTTTCPYCREDELVVGRLQMDVRVERAAASIVRPCKYGGCDYRGKRDELKAHIAACDKRPVSEALAAVTKEAEQWRAQRCWQLASISAQGRTHRWPISVRGQLELLLCRVHRMAGSNDDEREPRVDYSVDQVGVDRSLAQLPKTVMKLYTNPAGTPFLRLSHLHDQGAPTWCYVVKARDPSSARRIAIPAMTSVVIHDMLSEDDARDGVVMFLAKTLADFGLNGAGHYAIPTIDPY
jgi:hypothetical protein